MIDIIKCSSMFTDRDNGDRQMTDNIQINYKSDNFITYTDKVTGKRVMYEIERNKLVEHTKIDDSVSYGGIEQLHMESEATRKKLLQGRSYI